MLVPVWVSLAAPKRVSKWMVFKMASSLNFANWLAFWYPFVLVPVWVPPIDDASFPQPNRFKTSLRLQNYWSDQPGARWALNGALGEVPNGTARESLGRCNSSTASKPQTVAFTRNHDDDRGSQFHRHGSKNTTRKRGQSVSKGPLGNWFFVGNSVAKTQDRRHMTRPSCLGDRAT